MTTWTLTVAIIADDFPDLYLSGHPFLQVNENKCLMVGGYTTMLGKENDSPTDTLVQIQMEAEVISEVKVTSLGSGPIAQSTLILTPEEDVFILCGGSQERWALVSKYIAPAVPCDLNALNLCILVSNPSSFMQDFVDWLGCDGECGRWFHAPCLKLTPEQFKAASQRRKWFCNRSDCRK